MYNISLKLFILGKKNKTICLPSTQICMYKYIYIGVGLFLFNQIIQTITVELHLSEHLISQVNSPDN